MTLSTHVLDTTNGRPAVGLPVRLEQWQDERTWRVVARGVTDTDGRLRDWAGELPAGEYRLIFDTGDYHGQDAFFPEVVVNFRMAEPNQHYHVPLLLSPFSYSTYRGS